MNKLFVSVLATAALAAGGAAFAQSADAEAQAGSAWRNHPMQPQTPPNPYAAQDAARGYGPAPGTPEYYGNSGWTPPSGYVYQGTDRWGRPAYGQAVPAAPYILGDGDRARARDRDRARARDRAFRNDRDGDGVRNRRDRHPDDSRRW